MENKSNGKAVASLVTGIVSIVLCWVPLIGLVCGVLGLVFYAKAKKALEAGEALPNSKGMYTAGMITGIIGLVFSFFYTIAWVIVMLAVGTVASAAAHGGYSNF